MHNIAAMLFVLIFARLFIHIKSVNCLRQVYENSGISAEYVIVVFPFNEVCILIAATSEKQFMNANFTLTSKRVYVYAHTTTGGDGVHSLYIAA